MCLVRIATIYREKHTEQSACINALSNFIQVPSEFSGQPELHSISRSNSRWLLHWLTFGLKRSWKTSNLSTNFRSHSHKDRRQAFAMPWSGLSRQLKWVCEPFLEISKEWKKVEFFVTFQTYWLSNLWIFLFFGNKYYWPFMRVWHIFGHRFQ